MFKKLFKKLRERQMRNYLSAATPMQMGGSWIYEEVDMKLNRLGVSANDNGLWFEREGAGVKKPEDKRIELKPKDVVEELNGDKPEVSFDNLDEKIKAIKKRRDFMRDDLGIITTEEDQALEWLEARKKGKKMLDEFNKWPLTTSDKIVKLLSKYKLQKAHINQYHLALPKEAIDEMEAFYNLFSKVTDTKPEFIIIADKMEEVDKKRDPILLATSPFGKFFHVLGAWDKEVEIMHELFLEAK